MAKSNLVFPPQSGTELILPLAVVDGDTFAFYFLVGQERARIRGVDAPELKGKTRQAGLAAREFLRQHLPVQPAIATLYGRDSFGRYLLDLQTGEGLLSELLLRAGHAVPYDRR